MFIFRHGSRRVAAKAAVQRHDTIRPYSLERTQIKLPHTRSPTASFPVIESCPVPTCQCQDLPRGLDIEREQNLSGTMAAYAEQILISTGKSDWKSRIEDEEGAHGDVVRGLKQLLGPKGKFSDVRATSAVDKMLRTDIDHVALSQRLVHCIFVWTRSFRARKPPECVKFSVPLAIIYLHPSLADRPDLPRKIGEGLRSALSASSVPW